MTREAGLPLLAARASAARFSILMKLQRFEEAKKTLEEAREYAKAANDKSLEPFLLHDQALLLENTEHFEEALSPVRQALTLFQQTHQTRHAAQVRISLGWALWELGQYDQARDQYEAFLKEAEPRERHLGVGNLGNLAYQQREYEKAVSFYETAANQAKDTNPVDYTRWLANEATGWIELGNLNKAEAANQCALAAGDKLTVMSQRPHVLLNQARIAARRGETAWAFQKLQEIANNSEEAGVALDAYSELVRDYQDLDDAASARKAYLAGLKVANNQRTGIADPENQLSFSASVMNLNQQYVAGLMAHGRVNEAFETAEASRAGMLRKSLNLGSAGDQAAQLPAYREAAKRTKTAYLAYWLAPERSFLWVITPDAFQCYPMPDERELRERIDRFQKLVQEREGADEEGAALFQTLVAPARKQLSSVTNVVIVPDGPLYGMNFETLRQGSASARYWIQDATISITPSLSLLLGKAGTQPQDRRMLLMGDAAEWSADFPRLLNSPGELDRIAAQFPRAERTRLTQAQATPAEYERQDLPSYRYIHFATHAAANRSAPLDSAIILSQAQGRGTLTARDVLAKPVSAELISISACRSAGARTYAGEGLVGLAWAFLHSGAHSVVAGLWDVSDYSSPLIMGALYGGLAQGASAPEALRAAKLELLTPGNKYADPYYWGPFLLYRGAQAQ